MEKTTLWVLYTFLFSASFLYPIHAGNKHTQAHNHLYMAKWFRNSAINNNHFKSLQHAKKGNKQTQALNHLYRAKWALNSAIDTSHFEPPQHVNINDSVLAQEGLKKKDKIDRLPGQPYVRFDQYGGYVTVNQSAGRAFYYYFVEADNTTKESLPLLLWLNGGPGCSSLAYGAMQELGPFRVNSDGKTLYRNDFSWNHAANVLFVESPAGVGFSYSNTSWDYDYCGDKSTAIDNYVFLLNWLERFPEYKEREFYISGESYAGHYVPQLADAILYHNKMANRTSINLKGILIGNAVINDETDTMGMYDYLGSHAIVSDEILDQVRIYCDFSQNATQQTEKCLAANSEVSRNLDNIDMYNIYAPLCSKEILTSKPKPMSHAIDPCSDHYTYVYMNRQDVQEALHANVTMLDHDWEACSDVINKWNDSPSSVIPLLKEFMKNNLRVWIFSGDTDARVSVTSTKYSINAMGLPLKTPWQAWAYHGKVGGFAQVYEGDLRFVTVLGAGHQVPSYKPRSALGLVTHFLSGKSLNDYSRY